MREFWQRNKRVIAAVVLLLALPGGAGASTLPNIMISEVQTGSQASAGEEFIELINLSSSAIDVSNWRVEYYPASTTNFDKPLRTMLLHGLLPVGECYLLASKDYLADKANDNFSAGLAASGGHLRLVQQENGQDIIREQLSWGSIVAPDITGIPAPESGKSVQRKTENNLPVYTGNPLADFIQGDPTPQGTQLLQDPPEEPIDTPQPTTATQTEPDNAVTVDIEQLAENILLPKITELMPNPAPPLTDADDEFVELYNEGTQAFDLSGYKLQTGATFNHNYTFPTGSVLGAGVYNAYYVSQTNATLANTGGKARLVSPTGQVVSQTEPYEDADDGQSWAWNGQAWTWSTTPTPGAPNVINAPQLASTTTSSKSAAKKSTSKPKTKAVATKASAKAAKPKANTVAAQANSVDDTSSKSNIHPLILAGVGGTALLYGVYEYRQDIANAFYKLRRYRKSG